MTTDAKTIRLVIAFVGLIGLALLALIGIVCINDSPAEVPEALWGAFSFVAGGLVGMLARTSASPDATPQPQVNPLVDRTLGVPADWNRDA